MADDAKVAAFLAWREERSEATFEFDAFGSTWDLPKSMPAELWFWHRELLAQGRSFDKLTGAEFERATALLVPEPVLAEWVAFPRVRIEDIGEAIGRLIWEYLFGSPGEGDAEGEARPATTSATRSSSTSRSSKRTSSGSTGSKTSAKRSKKG